MSRNAIIVALTSAAVCISTPAVAQGQAHGGHGGGAGNGGVHGNAGMNGSAGMGMDMRGISDVGSMNRADARLNSQGPMHASETGIAHASANSVLSGDTVVGGPLTGLTVGAEVVDSTGARIGTVERVASSSDGTIRRILVRSTNGHRMITLSPANVSLSGSILTALDM